MKKKISTKYSEQDIKTATALKTIILGLTEDQSLPAEVKIELIRQLNFKDFQKHEKTISASDVTANLTKNITILPVQKTATQQIVEEQGFLGRIFNSCKCIADEVLPRINYNVIKKVAQDLIAKTGIDQNTIAVIQFMIDGIIAKIETKYSDVEITTNIPKTMTDKQSSPPTDQYQINVYDMVNQVTSQEVLNEANLNIELSGDLSDEVDLVDML